MLEDVTKLMQLLIRNLGILQQFIIMTQCHIWRHKVHGTFRKGSRMLENVFYAIHHRKTTFISNLDKETKSLGRLQFQPLGDVLTEIFGSRTRLNFKRVVRVVGEIDFV